MELQTSFGNNKMERLGRYLIIFSILAGSFLRIYFWWQGRDLFIDEANVVRNLYERDFVSLLQPLDYGQYAPPIFLWFQKIVTLIFSFGERAVRFYALLCSIVSLLMLRTLLRRLEIIKGAWYAIVLFSFGSLVLYYSVTVKQYSGDALATIFLLLAALQFRFKKNRTLRFNLIWMLIGSIAIWFSMPSVFILAGVLSYYFYKFWIGRNRKQIFNLVLIASVWLVQFLIYYYFILSNQIHSDYLQNYHEPFFLSVISWQKNFNLIQALFSELGGSTVLAYGLHFLLFVLGAISIYKKKKEYFILLFIPLLSVLAAAFLKQFTLMPRVMLFSFPILLIVIAFGAQDISRRTQNYFIIVLLLAAVINVSNFKTWKVLKGEYRKEEITKGFDYVKEPLLKGSSVFISHLTKPTFYYYTQIHPAAKKYEYLKKATLLNWDTDLKQISAQQKVEAYFVYSHPLTREEQEKRNRDLASSMELFSTFERTACYVFGYRPK